jgi:hypothetical protein
LGRISPKLLPKEAGISPKLLAENGRVLLRNFSKKALQKVPKFNHFREKMVVLCSGISQTDTSKKSRDSIILEESSVWLVFGTRPGSVCGANGPNACVARQFLHLVVYASIF